MALRPFRPQSRPEQLAQAKAAQNDVFLREVDDALRQDEMVGAAKRYGVPLGIGLVLGLVGLAGFLWWQSSQNDARGERSLQLVNAIDSIQAGRADAAAKDLAPLSAKGGDASQAAAQLLQGGVALSQGKTADAVKLFGQVAGNEDYPKPYRDLATIRAAAAEFDTLPPQTIVDRLKPLAVAGSPWFGSAGELVGLAYLRQNRNDLAGPLFAEISRDKEVSESLRARARQMAGFLGVDAIDDVNEAAGTGAGAAAPAAAAQ